METSLRRRVGIHVNGVGWDRSWEHQGGLNEEGGLILQFQALLLRPLTIPLYIQMVIAQHSTWMFNQKLLNLIKLKKLESLCDWFQAPGWVPWTDEQHLVRAKSVPAEMVELPQFRRLSVPHYLMESVGGGKARKAPPRSHILKWSLRTDGEVFVSLCFDQWIFFI